jgi:hypothetical protein
MGRARSPATVTHTRFFTIINQHMPRPSADRRTQFLVFAAFSRSPAQTRRKPGTVEVIGLEPTTPCLQSRCSPS